MNRNRLRRVMNAARGALLTVVAAGNAHAQAPTTPPPAVRQQGEQLERLQQDREEAQRRQLQASPSALTPPASEQRRPWPEAESPCRAIQEVALVGDSSEAFRWVLADLIAGPDPAIGRCLGVGGANVAAERAQQALMARGFVTSRIVFEPQNLSSGRLTLTLLPGRIRAIRFATPDVRANAWNAVPAQPGDVLNLRDVEQALENFKRVPTAEADIQIKPADVPGRSDLVISWRQSLPFRLNVTLDDGGSEATGRYQGSATLSHDHWLTLNDLFYVTVNRDLGGGIPGDRGTQGHTVHYSLPWDHWLLGFTQSASRYLIEGDPRFTDYRQWLSSDYMFAALGSDPNGIQKRLGDGFYEQGRVRRLQARWHHAQRSHRQRRRGCQSRRPRLGRHRYQRHHRQQQVATGRAPDHDPANRHHHPGCPDRHPGPRRQSRGHRRQAAGAGHQPAGRWRH